MVKNVQAKLPMELYERLQLYKLHSKMFTRTDGSIYKVPTLDDVIKHLLDKALSQEEATNGTPTEAPEP